LNRNSTCQRQKARKRNEKAARTNDSNEAKADGTTYTAKPLSECGGILIVRKGKYGTFKGCNNYPECKVTQSIG
jgi:hypothetical protein